MKLISSLDVSKTLKDNNMETLIECQSEGNIKEHPLLTSCESEDSICQLIEVKKRKKVLSWPSLMRRLSPSSDFSGSLESDLKVPLFDQPLSIICGENNKLPRPIQDILTILCLKGPSTEGIFRKAASEKARKELKEELNCGCAVDLEVLPVHLLAVVFKDFLRGIPRKLLSCDLFEEWMGALEKPSEEDRIEALKQVAGQLPRPNFLLLRHLVYVLHLISKNAEVNRMDSSNLAICIGPNMLTLKNDQSLSFQAQKDLNNKVNTLVEFLIDNCFEIFGENILTHSRITSDDSLEHTDSSDVSTLQNDSAYDSNDPDTEPTSTVASPSRQLAGSAPPVLALDDKGQPDTCELGPEPIVSMITRLKSSISQQDRRFSEPNMSPSQECLGAQVTKQKLTKSEDGFSMPPADSCFESEDAEDPFPENFLPVDGKPKRPMDLKVKCLSQGLASTRGLVPKAFSSGSLGEPSDSSPTPSPSGPKRSVFTRHQSFTTKTDKSKSNREIKKHSMSFSFTSHKNMLSRTSSLEPGKSKEFPKEKIKKSLRKESQLAGRIIQECTPDIHSQTALGLSWSRTWALSVDNVFQLVDGRKPGNPPSYQEAIQCQASQLSTYGGQTVGSMRARMLSQEATLSPLLPSHHGDMNSEGTLSGHRPSPMTEPWQQSQTVNVSVETRGRSELHRLRTMSELLHKDKVDRVRQPCLTVFEVDQLQRAKESYI